MSFRRYFSQEILDNYFNTLVLCCARCGLTGCEVAQTDLICLFSDLDSQSISSYFPMSHCEPKTRHCTEFSIFCSIFF